VTRLVTGKKPAAQHVVALKLDRLFRDAADALNQTRKWDDARVARWTTSAGRAFPVNLLPFGFDCKVASRIALSAYFFRLSCAVGFYNGNQGPSRILAVRSTYPRGR